MVCGETHKSGSELSHRNRNGILLCVSTARYIWYNASNIYAPKGNLTYWGFTIFLPPGQIQNVLGLTYAKPDPLV